MQRYRHDSSELLVIRSIAFISFWSCYWIGSFMKVLLFILLTFLSWALLFPAQIGWLMKLEPLRATHRKWILLYYVISELFVTIVVKLQTAAHFLLNICNGWELSRADAHGKPFLQRFSYTELWQLHNFAWCFLPEDDTLLDCALHQFCRSETLTWRRLLSTCHLRSGYKPNCVSVTVFFIISLELIFSLRFLLQRSVFTPLRWCVVFWCNIGKWRLGESF